MTASVLLAGLDPSSLPEAPVLHREQHPVEELSGARALLTRLMHGGARLLLLGPALGSPNLTETVRRVRSSPSLRRVSILVVLPAEHGSLAADALKAGANAVLQQPLDPVRFDTWLTRLLSVQRRVDVRVAVAGQVLATTRVGEGHHFSGLTRNLSLTGMLLASPVRLHVGTGADIDLEISLNGPLPRFHAIGRVVREAPEVPWPYLGYGIEFLFVPPESQQALGNFLSEEGAARNEAPVIFSTIKRDPWIYEILAPTASRQGWQAEIRRAPREGWRPGEGGPFYVVEGDTPEDALRAARDFVHRHA